jgi:NitT/TauT family transport system substrate-binding protein
MHRWRFVLALAALGVACATTASAEPLRVRMSYVVPLSNWAPFMVAKKDLARHWGHSYDLEATRYGGTPEMVTALANGELELASLAYSTIGSAISNAGISDLRIVADEFRDGMPGRFSTQLFVRKDSAINQIVDLKAKVLATNQIGAGVDIAMKAGLRKHGLIDKRDYTVIEVPLPTMPQVLADKKADLVTAVMPFALNPQLNQIGSPLFDLTEGMGTTQFLMFAARKTFIDRHRAVLVDLFEDMIRIQRWYLDPNNNSEVAKVASDMVKLPTERFGWLFTSKDYYRDPDLMPDLDALQRNVNLTADMGFIRSRIDVKQHSDLSLVEEAARRLR